MILIKSLQRWFYPDVAVDLGTATTRAALIRGCNGFTSPSISQQVPALRAGVVVNIDAATDVLAPLFHRLRGIGLVRPRVLACAPSDTSRAEREAVIEACYRAGAGAVALIPEPVAAAIGDNIAPQSDTITLMMDIGEGVTDCALLCEGRLLRASATRMACANLRAAIALLVEERYNITLTVSESQHILEKVGVGIGPLDSEGIPLLSFLPVSGLGLTSIPSDVRIPLGTLRDATRPITDKILETILTLTTSLSREEQKAIYFHGLRLSGGGSLLPGMTELVSSATHLPVRRVRQPLAAVVRGARTLLPYAADDKLWERAQQIRATPN